MPTTFFAAGSIGLSVLTVMNMILFYRIFMADIVRGSGAEEEDEDTTSSQRPQYVRINPRVPPTNGAIKRRKNQVRVTGLSIHSSEMKCTNPATLQNSGHARYELFGEAVLRRGHGRDGCQDDGQDHQSRIKKIQLLLEKYLQ